MPPSRRPPPTSGGPPWWSILVLLALIVAGFWWWWRDTAMPVAVDRPLPQATAPYDGPLPAPGFAPGSDGGGVLAEPAPPVEPPQAEAALLDRAAPAPRYPLPPGAAQAGDPDLPALADSDAPILDALSGVAARSDLGRFGNLGDFTRRFVITVDNLPRELVPAQYSVVQRIPGPLAVADDGGRMVLQPQNYARYDAFTGFVERFGAKPMVALYLRFYPLLQQEYRAMGYPQGHFNDRVIAAIDDMLAAPVVTGEIRLIQPKVHYLFEDPALESLSAGRKIMIRVGPDNAARLKQVLREIRGELVR